MVEKKEIKHGRIDQMDRDEVEARLMKLIESNNLAPELASQLAPEEIPGDIIEGEIEIDPDSEEISPDETP